MDRSSRAVQEQEHDEVLYQSKSTIQRLHIAHYARGGVLAPRAADIDVWIDGAGAGAGRIEPDAEFTTILLRLVTVVNASCQRCKITTAAEKT